MFILASCLPYYPKKALQRVLIHLRGEDIFEIAFCQEVS